MTFWWLLLVFPGFLLLQLLTIIAAARFENRMVWPYGEPQISPQYMDDSAYGERYVSDSVAAGFVMLGWAPDLKGDRYKVSYAMLVSPDKTAFALVGVGSIWTLPLRGTWIFTFNGDGRTFYSTDNQACVEIDISRRWKSQLKVVKSFHELWSQHQYWMRKEGVIPLLLERSSAIRDFQGIRAERFRNMARSGLISYTNPAETHWRYTMQGAIKVAAMNLSIALARALSMRRWFKSA